MAGYKNAVTSFFTPHPEMSRRYMPQSETGKSI
jgi:hypothetical protein